MGKTLIVKSPCTVHLTYVRKLSLGQPVKYLSHELECPNLFRVLSTRNPSCSIGDVGTTTGIPDFDLRVFDSPGREEQKRKGRHNRSKRRQLPS